MLLGCGLGRDNNAAKHILLKTTKILVPDRSGGPI